MTILLACQRCGTLVAAKRRNQKWCRPCAKHVYLEKIKHWKVKNRDKVREYGRRSYAVDRQRLSAKQKEYRAANPEKYRDRGRRFMPQTGNDSMQNRKNIELPIAKRCASVIDNIELKTVTRFALANVVIT